ncbi:cytochrome P450 [Hypoxylon cercidicola]|nr:cytochrome P450 [Hypoxylon cercidicola]
MLWYHHALAVVVGLVAVVLFRRSGQRDKDKSAVSLPIIGVDFTQYLPWTRASVRSITSSNDTASRGYREVCKKDEKPFLMPSFGIGSIVVLNPSSFDILNKSENDVMAFPAQMEVMQPRYMMGDRTLSLFKNAIQFDVVRRHMTKDVSFFTPNTADELANVFKHSLKLEQDDWRVLTIWDTCLKIIGRTANRTFIGLPLCRNETLLEQSTLYAKTVFQGATLITALPPLLRPLLGPIIGLTAKKYASNCMRILEPYVKDRLILHQEKDKIPNDALQWMIEESVKGHSGEASARTIAHRLLILQMVSTYTTTYALVNIIINIYGSDSRADILAGLRSECDRVAEAHHGLTTKEAINQLYRVDSAVRESLRVSPFAVIAPLRMTALDKVLDLDGVSLPPGTRLGVPFQAVHHDERFYEKPLEYDAFRFSREFEGLHDYKLRAAQQQLAVNTSESFLTFGYGRHVCPGRWYTAQTLKQALAYIVQNHDVELVGKPAQSKSMLNTILPPFGSTMRIRRRM